MTTKENRGPRPTPVLSRERATISREDSEELRAVREAVRGQDAQLDAAAGALRDVARGAALNVSPAALREIADAADARPHRSPFGGPWT